ncbi:MAG: DUF979 domain-containing protein [Oscillospiraceae bacterium]|nr:DUF979 domain-containing protein [Oscillospiraceae bacterium]
MRIFEGFINPVTFFSNPEIATSAKLLEIMFIIMGLVCIHSAIRNLTDKENKSPVGSCIFWGVLGIVLMFGRFLPSALSGVLIVIMTLPPIFKRVKAGRAEVPSEEYTKKKAEQIGLKIFIPAFSIGVSAIFFALVVPSLGALVGVGVGVVISAVTLIALNHDNKPKVFLGDSRRMLDVIGPLCMLPMLLASLGAVFTAAGVGDVIAELVAPLIPDGNMTIGIIVYALGMVLFTMIMGNAFAAITVMTVGIGYPFVLALGADPVVIGMLALTVGFCGTLMTPMAANFNIVPVAMLDIKDKYAVIKNQLAIAVPVMLFQIILMIIFS